MDNLCRGHSKGRGGHCGRLLHRVLSQLCASADDGLHCNFRHAVCDLRPPVLYTCTQGKPRGCSKIKIHSQHTHAVHLAHRGMDSAEAPLVAWQGPSVSIDTACSSSLVGTHLAATSFLSADCPRALVCGVNLTMRAETTAVLSKAGMLAQVIPLAICTARIPCALSTQQRHTCRGIPTPCSCKSSKAGPPTS